MNEKDVQAFVVDTCQKVISSLAQMHKLEDVKLNVRIDMQELHTKPVFALFNQSALITQCSMKEIIHAGGGQGLEMVVGTYLRNIIKDIFSASMKQFEIESTRQMFVLLSLRSEDGVKIPIISIYKNGRFLDSVVLGDFIQVA